MTKYEELLSRVTADPDDDDVRIAFARHIRPSDPDRAQFIEDQIGIARARRAKRGWLGTTKGALLSQHETEWTRTIAKYAKAWRFDRGFVTKITIDPDLFLEYGDYLFVIEPIRVVEFVPPEQGDFPMAELAASPLLERLDAITFMVPTLAERDLELLAASSHLSRTLYLATSEMEVTSHVYEAFAATPQGQRMLRVLFSSKNFPGQSYEDTGKDDWWGAPIYDWTDVRPEGHAIERKYGYVPWLHPEENDCTPFDAAYYVAQGILPVKPPGSPV